MPLISTNNPNQPNLPAGINLTAGMEIVNNDSGVKEYRNVQDSSLTQQVMPALPDISNTLDAKLNTSPLIQNQVLPNPNSQKQYTLSQILSEAVKQKASDVHLTVGYRAILRVDGALKTLPTPLLQPEELKAFARELISQRKDLNLDTVNEIDLGYAFENRRFRINIFKQMGTFAIVGRMIPDRIATLDELNMPPLFKEFAHISNGLVLVTGPTGSGKSTTIAAVLNHINTTQAKHIVTLEDPIEFVFPKGISLVDQREFGVDFASWENALKSLLRQDPNVVLVGEMRDTKTIAATITVSETGHLVFATLHTNSASQSIDRIIDVFPESQQAQIRTQLANVITAVISQRLIPLKNGGRKAALEIMIANSAIKNAIRESKTYLIDNMIQTGQDMGMISMEKSLVQMIKMGEISVATAKTYSIKPNEIDILLKG